MNEHIRYLTFSPTRTDINNIGTYLRTIFNSSLDTQLTATPEGKFKFMLETGGHTDLTFPLYYRMSLSHTYLGYLWEKLQEEFPNNIDRQRSWYSFYEQQHLFFGDVTHHPASNPETYQKNTIRYYWCGILPDRNKPLYRYTTYEYFYLSPQKNTITLYEDIQAGNGDLIILPNFTDTPEFDPHRFRSLISQLLQILGDASNDSFKLEYLALKETYADLRPWFDERFYDHYMRITSNTPIPETVPSFRFYFPNDNTPRRYAIDEPVYPGRKINWYIDVVTKRRTVIDKSQITTAEHKITTGGFLSPLQSMTNYLRLHETLFRELPPLHPSGPFPNPITLSSFPQNLYETISLDLRIPDPSNDPLYYYIEDAARIKAWN